MRYEVRLQYNDGTAHYVKAEVLIAEGATINGGDRVALTLRLTGVVTEDQANRQARMYLDRLKQLTESGELFQCNQEADGHGA